MLSPSPWCGNKQHWRRYQAISSQSSPEHIGLHQQGLAESDSSLIGSHHTAYEREKVIGHLIIMDQATQWLGSSQTGHSQ